jgi:hypothetical protein
MEKWLDDLYDLCDTVSREISEANKKIRDAGGKLSGSDLTYIDQLTHTLKSVKTVIAMEESEHGGESGGYPYYMDMRYPSYGDAGMRNGRSGARRRDAMGRYSRDNRGYSRDDAKSDFIDDVRDLMHDAPDDRIKMRFKEFIREIENA